MGAYHKEKQGDNQDALYELKNTRFSVFALADGTTACKRGNVGAEIACKTTCEYLLDTGENMFDFDNVKVAFLIIEQVLHALEKKSDAEGIPLEEYASTLVFCLFDGKKNKALLFNLGDGAIFISDNDTCRLILAPLSLDDNACALTTTKGAYKAAQVKVSSIEMGESVLICSDGFFNLMKDKTGEDRIKHAIMAGDYKGLCDYLDSAETPDDCSFIFCTDMFGY